MKTDFDVYVRKLFPDYFKQLFRMACENGLKVIIICKI